LDENLSKVYDYRTQEYIYTQRNFFHALEELVGPVDAIEEYQYFAEKYNFPNSNDFAKLSKNQQKKTLRRLRTYTKKWFDAFVYFD
jgi:hypothetical protein